MGNKRLTLVSVNGRVMFCWIATGKDGKTRLPYKAATALFGVRRDDCIYA